MPKGQQIVHENYSKKKPKNSLVTLFMALSIAIALILCWISRFSYENIQPPRKEMTLMANERNIKNKFYPCPKRHKIAYIWTFGEMPEVYKDFVKRCSENIIILNETVFEVYLKKWNDKYPQHAVKNPEKLRFNTRNDYLKRFYLYFEGGIYADFDTEINEECWEDLVSDKILHTNTWGGYGSYSLPEENFMMVPRPLMPDLKQWIIELNYETRWMGNRWDRCRMEQCLIVFCQKHNYDNSWVGLEK